MKYVHWLLLAAFAAGNAVAQAGKRPDPSDPRASVPASPYRSAFEGYRTLEEAKRTPWRDANEEAARTGGHVGILRDQAARERDKQGERK